MSIHSRDPLIQAFFDRTVRQRIEAAERRLLMVTTYNGVLAAIDEILVHMLGAERLAIVEPHADGPRLLHSRQVGVRPAANTSRATGGVGLTATVPLSVAGRLLATVVVFGFSESKHRLDPVDRRILDVIAHRGAMALHRALGASMSDTVRAPKVG